MTANYIIKIAIADDHKIFRDGIKITLSGKQNLKMLWEAEDGKDMMHKIAIKKPDVLLMDIRMPEIDGINGIELIRKEYDDIRIIVLTMYDDHQMISKMMEMGANAYLTKNSDSEVIYEAVKTVFQQEYFFNTLTNKALIDGLRHKRQAESAMPSDAKLTDKEVTILKLMCEEKSTKEIADIVDLSPRTVEAIRDKLKTKTGTKSMAGLVMYAVKAGLVEQA